MCVVLQIQFSTVWVLVPYSSSTLSADIQARLSRVMSVFTLLTMALAVTSGVKTSIRPHMTASGQRQGASRAPRIPPIQLQAQSRSARFWEAWRLHDAFNLAVLPIVTAWTGTALIRTSMNIPLARVFAAYIAFDGLWIALMPQIVKAPRVLLAHHMATLVLLWHPLTYTSHKHFISWMTIVELNTFFLILRRHWTHPLIELCFKVTWVAIRTAGALLHGEVE